MRGKVALTEAALKAVTSARPPYRRKTKGQTPIPPPFGGSGDKLEPIEFWGSPQTVLAIGLGKSLFCLHAKEGGDFFDEICPKGLPFEANSPLDRATGKTRCCRITSARLIEVRS